MCKCISFEWVILVVPLILRRRFSFSSLRCNALCTRYYKFNYLRRFCKVRRMFFLSMVPLLLHAHRARTFLCPHLLRLFFFKSFSRAILAVHCGNCTWIFSICSNCNGDSSWFVPTHTLFPTWYGASVVVAACVECVCANEWGKRAIELFSACAFNALCAFIPFFHWPFYGRHTLW